MDVNSPIFVPMGHISTTVPIPISIPIPIPVPVPVPVPSAVSSVYSYLVYDVTQSTVKSTSCTNSHSNSCNQYNTASNYKNFYKPHYQSQLQHHLQHQQRSRCFQRSTTSQIGLLPTPTQNNVTYQFISSRQFWKTQQQEKQQQQQLLITKEFECMQRFQRRSSKTNPNNRTQIQVDTEPNDTLQRDGSKTSHSARRKSIRDTKNDNKTDGSLTIRCQKQKSARSGHNRKNQKSQNSDSEQKKLARVHSKEFDNLLKKKLNGIRDLDFASNAEYFASGTEESIIKRHNPKHRNSSASDVASISDDVNSVSSREDLSDTYDLVKVNKKTARVRRNRKQRRQQQQEQQHKQQPSELPQQKKQSRCSSSLSSSSGTSSPLLSQQQKSNKTARKNCKDINTAIAQQLPPKTAKDLIDDPTACSSSSSPSISALNSVTSSPTASPKAKRISKVRHVHESPLGLVEILSEYEIASYLTQYIPDAKKLRNFGYPVESSIYEGCIEIYKSVPRFFPPRVSNNRHQHHHQHIGVVNSTDGLKNFTSQNRKLSSGDSGKGSGTSTPLSYNVSPADSDYSEEENTTDFVYSQILEKTCVRCRKPFKVTTNGEYVTRGPCFYHWGKQEAGEYMDEKGDSTSVTFFSCCKKVPPEPCTRNHVHVWTDITSGLNGPYTDFVHTLPRRRMNETDSDDEIKIYALDCEMSYTGFGMEVTKVTVVSYNGKQVYESIVHPRSEVGDYNTRFSGVSEKDFMPGSGARTLETVQKDLLLLIDADDILIGHALENDLRSLRIVHKCIVDTAIIFPHPNGFPFRRGLKSIVAAELGREIQADEGGHSSLEDSQACLELMLLKVRTEWRAKSSKKAKSERQPKIPKSEQFVVVTQQSALVKQKA